ncbi:MAG: prepilin-type N-terminal cleavage/methylation domain-containing protein [Bacillota bacterium]|jgi:type II secretion system protein G|nr:prepilin-type N-terminal cleavage/methylation domain-containing protein [Bacillota bacterium]
MLWIHRRRKQEGFTLIELLAVVAILAVLILIAVPIITSNINDAKITSCESNIKMLNSAIQRYYFTEGKYPDSLDDLVGKYIDEKPKCPISDKDYDSDYDKTTGKITHSH